MQQEISTIHSNLDIMKTDIWNHRVITKCMNSLVIVLRIYIYNELSDTVECLYKRH